MPINDKGEAQIDTKWSMDERFCDAVTIQFFIKPVSRNWHNNANADERKYLTKKCISESGGNDTVFMHDFHI